MRSPLTLDPAVSIEPHADEAPRRARAEPRTLKAIVLVLALAASAKVGLKEYLFHTSATEVIAAAYRERAAEACRKHPRALDFGLSAGDAFGDDARSSVLIGKPDLDVYLWQIDHPKWDARYRNPYLQLTAQSRTGGGQVVCDYDIVNARAQLRRK